MFRRDRMRALMEAQRISQSEMARRVGVTPTSIWRLLQQETRSTQSLAKIARVLSTTTDYLMGQTDDPDPAGMRYDSPAALRDSAQSPNDLVKIDPIEAMLVSKSLIVQREEIPDPIVIMRSQLHRYSKAPTNLIYYMDNLGETMSPTIQSADLVLIDTAQTHVKRGGQVWACISGSTPFLARLRHMPEAGIRLSCDNPAIADELAPRAAVRIIGRVIAHFRAL